MGIYAITGGTKGIGAKTTEILRSRGHDVITIAKSGADISADLGVPEDRTQVVAALHRLCPDGLDGLVCNHGISPAPKYQLSYLLSVNYFGAIAVMEGTYDLLKMRKGSCVATASAAIVSKQLGKYFVDELLISCGDEDRIGRLVNTFPLQEDGIIIYISAKLALCQWIRRTAPSWAAHGVNLNAVAPGGVATTIMQDFDPPDDVYFPMPALFGQNRKMDPTDVAQSLAYMVLPESKGICGHILFCDAGSAAVFDTERSY